MTHATAAPFCYFAPEFAHRLTAHPLRRRTQVTEDFAIQPEKITPTLDASKWPLLLKNYDKLMVREADHPTPPNAIRGFFLPDGNEGLLNPSARGQTAPVRHRFASPGRPPPAAR
jgi:hypothetical protein